MGKMTLSEELKWRGFINQTTLSDIKELDKLKIKFYNGFDASSDSLQVGNLAAIMMDKVFLRHGAEGVALAGGATSMIGDPGGKDSERPLQSEETIEKNVEGVRKQLDQLLGSQTKLVNNLDWFKNMNVVEYLRDVGKHFSMTPIIQRDYIAKRIGEGGSGISYAELSYTLLQGYDFLKLYDTYGVNLQLAGSDQWGNSLSGVELIKKVRNVEVNVFTCPLIINQSTGIKFGKSKSGTVWLDPTKTSPLDFYQFFINLDDKGVEGYLKIFTELDKEKIDKIIIEHSKDRTLRHAQITLAREVTRLVHGEQATKIAEEQTKVISGQINLTKKSLDELREGDEAIKILSISSTPIDLIEVLVNSGLANSKGEARRLIEGKAIYVNDESFLKDVIDKTDFSEHGLMLIRKGKNRSNVAIIELT